MCPYFLDRAKDIWEILKSRPESQCSRHSLKKKKALELISNNVQNKKKWFGCLCFLNSKWSLLASPLFYQIRAKSTTPNSENPSQCQLSLKKSPACKWGVVSTGKPLHPTLSIIVAINWDKVSLSFLLFRTSISKMGLKMEQTNPCLFLLWLSSAWKIKSKFKTEILLCNIIK